MADNGDEPEAEQMQMEKLFCPKWKSYLCDDTLWSWADYKSVKVLEVKVSVLVYPAGNFDSISQFIMDFECMAWCFPTQTLLHSIDK